MRTRLLLGAVCALASPAPALADSIASGPLAASVNQQPWHVKFVQKGGTTLSEAPAATLAFHTTAGWMQATSVATTRRDGKNLLVDVATTDPAGRHIAVRIFPGGSGVLAMRAVVDGDAADVDAMRIGFTAPAGERFFGFGERSDVLDQRGHDVENYVSDGPFPEGDRALVSGTIPPQGFRARDDATYYPVPWLLSSRGYGVLIDRDETSTFHVATQQPDVWSAEVQSHAISLRVFAGPHLAQVLRRFTAATGRQPPPVAPWQFGPWFQTGQPNTVPLADESAMLAKLRKADAPVSAAETQLRYLPCGLDRGNEDYEAQRVKFFHAHGLAILTYVNPEICASYEPLFGQAAAADALQKNAAGAPATFDAFVGGTGPAGFTIQPVAQFDFTSQGAVDVYGALLRRILAVGHDGWMEDFGEYTPPDAHDSVDSDPSVIHNSYPTTYHCGVASILGRRPVVRFQRSGWTGSARCAQDVWGGDPTTTFGFDGLSSAVKQALSIGMSGVSRWGSDIGGYDTIADDPQLTPELLKRWIEFGAVSGVMRTKLSGIAIPSYTRPQIFDDDIVAVWRKYAKLHTQLYPYLRGADAQYRATGMPLMRAPALIEPGAPATDDAFGFGDALFAAPVVAAGQSTRVVRLPQGHWSQGLAYRVKGGAWVAKRAKALRGGRTVRVGAAIDELPLFVRAGALIPLLPADTNSLYRRTHFDTLRLLAFPRKRSQIRIFDSESARSRLTAHDWTLTLHQTHRRKLQIEAVLPWRACGAGVSTHAGVTRVTKRIRSGRIRITRCP
jgi:alpha-glucosidase (family GH31 glycosyl hydrolase)